MQAAEPPATTPSRLILVGGGHAHLLVLQALATRRPQGVDITLISPSRWQHYSGMLPGWMKQHYALDDCRIDLLPLLRQARVHFIEDHIVGMDAEQRCVCLSDGTHVHYDLLSLDVGSEVNTEWLTDLGPKLLPIKPPPLVREHRLYQADWLLRFYGFAPQEVVDAADSDGMLPLDIDPKLAWALKHRAHFPLDVNSAPKAMLWRVPGLGTKAVDAIVKARRWRRLRLEDVGRLTVSIAKIRPFITAEGWSPGALTDMEHLRASVAPKVHQLELFA